MSQDRRHDELKVMETHHEFLSDSLPDVHQPSNGDQKPSGNEDSTEKLIIEEEFGDVCLELGTLPPRQESGHARRKSIKFQAFPKLPNIRLSLPSIRMPSVIPAKEFFSRLHRRLEPHLSWDIFQRCSKAVLAFYLSSLFVYIPVLSQAFGPSIFLAPFAVLFFPPVKTVGGILENVIIGVVGVLFGSVIALLALASAARYNRTQTSDTPIGGTLIQVLFLTVGVFCIGYVRATYTRLNPATLTSVLVMVIPLTSNLHPRELVASVVWQIAYPFFIGAGVSLLVDIVVFPNFSGRILRSSIQNTVEESSHLLDLLVQGFLLTDANDRIPLDEILISQAAVRASIAKTKAARRECHYEVTYDRYAPEDYKVLVKPLQEMMKYLSGMVSCIKIEKALIEMEDEEQGPDARPNVLATLRRKLHESSGDPNIRLRNVASSQSMNAMTFLKASSTQTVTSAQHLTVQSFRSMRSRKAASMEMQAEINEGHHVQLFGREITGGMFGGSKRVFKKYLISVRPMVLNLSHACKECMAQSAAYMVKVNEETKNDTLVGRSYSTMRHQSKKVRTRVNSQSENLGGLASVATSMYDMPVEDSTIAANESLIAKLKTSITQFEEIQWSVIERISHQVDPVNSPAAHPLDDADITHEHWNAANLFREEYFLAFFFIFNMREAAKKVVRFVEAVEDLRKKRAVKPRFWLPKMKVQKWLKGDGLVWRDYEIGRARDIPQYTEGKETFLAPGWSGRVRFFLHQCYKRSTNHSVKFALKMSVATLLLAWPAYVWPEWWKWSRGSWAMITMLMVLSPSVGGSNSFGLYRVVGTIAGALWGYITWIIAPKNPYSISVMTIIFAYPCWYIFITTPHSRLGTTALITFNVVVNTAYVTYDIGDQDSVSLLAWKRMTTITIGVLVALIVTSYIWPFVARIELRRGLSRSAYLMGILYSRLAVCIADEHGVYAFQNQQRREQEEKEAEGEYSIEIEEKNQNSVRSLFNVLRSPRLRTKESRLHLAVPGSPATSLPDLAGPLFSPPPTNSIDLSTRGDSPTDSSIPDDASVLLGLPLPRSKVRPVTQPISHYVLAKHQKDRQYVRALERQLGKSMAAHVDLLALTPNEPRLKGPFPHDVYSEVVTCMQNLVDRMANVRRIVDGEYESAFWEGPAEDGFGDFIRREIIQPVERYRVDMVMHFCFRLLQCFRECFTLTKLDHSLLQFYYTFMS
ncbi:hypothetical protein DFS34DRAFT_598690 [Phlyctochytrium arcticum]|nr:hypothetical protein DFS34DRAFT_598690 [Phlyctochytrium arcticum]